MASLEEEEDIEELTGEEDKVCPFCDCLVKDILTCSCCGEDI